MSMGGLFVGTLSVPQEGAAVEVELRAPGKIAVAVQGLVWWTAPAGRSKRPGFGLRILDEDEGYQRLVSSLR